MPAIKHWISASRLRTLPLSVSGIIAGCGLADFLPHLYKADDTYFVDDKNYSIFILCILTTIAFQILSNFANDYGDGVKGADANRKGEKRLVASGDISANAMKRGVIITAIISLILAIATLYIAFGTENLGYSMLFLFLGSASIVAAIKYTVGKNAYGYLGFGDVFVFLFFGLLATVGSNFLYVKHIQWEVFLPAISVGLLSVAVLNLNNMRDQVEDKLNNKMTLVVKLGAKKAKIYHVALILIALLSALIYVSLSYYSPIQYMFLIAFVPLVIHLNFILKTDEFAKMDKELKKVALSTFLFAILLAIFNY